MKPRTTATHPLRRSDRREEAKSPRLAVEQRGSEAPTEDTTENHFTGEQA